MGKVKQMSRMLRTRNKRGPNKDGKMSKADQRAWIEHWGGVEAVMAQGSLIYTPPPGGSPEIRH